MVLPRFWKHVANVILGACLTTTPILAAEFNIAPFPNDASWANLIYGAELSHPRFLIEMNGPVEVGDADRLKNTYIGHIAKLHENAGFEFSEENFLRFSFLGVLSLNSPGGDFREGIAMASVTRDLGIPTLVEADASCLSACAVAFMGGFQYEIESEPFRRRILEAGGELGFHRPFLDRVEGFDPTAFEGLTQDEIDEVMSYEYSQFYDLANELIQEMLAVDANAWSNELLLRMLLASADENGAPTFTYLERVGEAIEWNIDIAGVRYDPAQTRADFFENTWWICYNSTLKATPGLDWRQDGAGERDFDLAQFIVGEKTEGPLQGFDVEIWGMTGEGCKVEASTEYQMMESLGVYVSFSAATDLHYLFNPKTKLSEISARSGQPNQTRLEIPLGRCWVFRDNRMLDNEPCSLSETNLGSEWNRRPLRTFTWPSGNQTKIETTFKTNDLINGNPAINEYRNGFHLCKRNTVSGNTFCYSLK